MEHLISKFVMISDIIVLLQICYLASLQQQGTCNENCFTLSIILNAVRRAVCNEKYKRGLATKNIANLARLATLATKFGAKILFLCYLIEERTKSCFLLIFLNFRIICLQSLVRTCIDCPKKEKRQYEHNEQNRLNTH